MFVALEWTSAAFHAYQIDGTGVVIDEISTSQGVNSVEKNQFANVLHDTLANRLDGANAVLVSGMATSRTGWVETPYAQTPAGYGEIAALAVHRRVDDLPPLVFLPGVAQRDPLPDVMRGEELAVLGTGLAAGTLVLAGAHSKWVTLEDQRIVGLSTYLSGELRRLLLGDSIISRLVPTDTEDDADSFRRGIDASDEPGRALFSARSLAVFEQLQPRHIPSYLEGILIGWEVRERLGRTTGPLHVAGPPALREKYVQAARFLGQQAQVAETNAVAGFFRVAQELGIA